MTATPNIWGRIAGALLPDEGQRDEARGTTATANIWMRIVGGPFLTRATRRGSGDDSHREYLGEDRRRVPP